MVIFNEPAYFVFLFVVALVFRYLPARWRTWWIAATGIAFYAYFSPAFAPLLLIESAVVFALAALASRVRQKRLAWGRAVFLGTLAGSVGVLGFYKYGGFLVRTVRVIAGSAVTSSAGASGMLSFEDVRLPLAISFFTFEFIHYLVDRWKGRIDHDDAGGFFAFAFFAPTMVAGPIKRYQSFGAQLPTARASAADVSYGVTRILVGLVKKMVIADTLTLWITTLTDADALSFATRPEIVIALIAYGLRIYLDFSGYSDIAIGSARLFGITVPENFSWPYLRTNISMFWRSWHISLSSWITDYVFIPLGGSRSGLSRTCLNLMIAMAVSGLWHGAAWHFVVWGLYHGVLLALHRIWRTIAEKHLPAVSTPLRRAGAIAGWALTYVSVTAGWSLFAMPLPMVGTMLMRLSGGDM